MSWYGGMLVVDVMLIYRGQDWVRGRVGSGWEVKVVGRVSQQASKRHLQPTPHHPPTLQPEVSRSRPAAWRWRPHLSYLLTLRRLFLLHPPSPSPAPSTTTISPQQEGRPPPPPASTMCHNQLLQYACGHTTTQPQSCKRGSPILKRRCLSTLTTINPSTATKISSLCYPCIREPFRFLDLPRELRDLIYNFCNSNDAEAPRSYSWPRQKSSTKVLIRGKPWVSLLLCSKQLFREYRARVVKGVEVVLVDYFRTGMALDTPKLHANLLSAPVEFKFLLLAPCERCEKGIVHAHCYVRDEFTCQQRWVAALTEQLVRPKRVDVRFDVWWPPKAEGELEFKWPSTPHAAFSMQEEVGKFLEVPKLTGLEVFRNRGMVMLEEGTNGREMEGAGGELVARWRKEGIDGEDGGEW